MTTEEGEAEEEGEDSTATILRDFFLFVSLEPNYTVGRVAQIVCAELCKPVASRECYLSK